MGFPIGYTLSLILDTLSVVDNPLSPRNADSLPTVLMRKNGSTGGVTTLPAINLTGTGLYTVTYTFTEAEWAHGDCYSLGASWTMEGVSMRQRLAQGYVENLPFIAGTVSDGAPTASGFSAAAGLSAQDGAYVGMFLVFLTGPLRGIPLEITGYIGATRTFAFATPFPGAPANGTPFWLIGRGA